MKRMPFKRPTTHYDERAKDIDEKICELIKERKTISNDNPGYPPFEYISNWAEKYDLYEDMLKSVFGSLWNEKMYVPLVEPEGFKRNLPVLKYGEIDNKIFSVVYIRQYSNSSIVNFNVTYDDTCDLDLDKPRHSHFQLSIDDNYNCRMKDGGGVSGNHTYNFIVTPPLPDDVSGIKLIFKEYDRSFSDNALGEDIVIEL